MSSGNVWNRVDLGGGAATDLERLIEGVFVYGHRNHSGPFAAVVDTDGRVHTASVPGAGAVTSASFCESFDLVVGRERPTLFAGDVPGGPGVSGHGLERVDEFYTDGAVRLWAACGDEDPMYLTIRSDGRLLIGEPHDAEHNPDAPGLRAADGILEAELLVGAGESNLYVAGRLHGGGHPAGQQLWVGGDGWQRLDPDPAPDAFTDIFSTHEPVIAGHAQARPVLIDAYGRAMEAPPVSLDPQHPHVCVARAGSYAPDAVRYYPWAPDPSLVPPVEGLLVAVQAVDAGPQLWSRGPKGWSVQDLPPGRLAAARVEQHESENTFVWVVISDQLWRVQVQPAP